MALCSNSLAEAEGFEIEARLSPPWATFGGEELYDTIPKKAAALAFSLVRNHAFVDGNKRIGHAAMEVFLTLNGSTLNAGVDEQEELFLSLAAGEISRDPPNPPSHADHTLHVLAPYHLQR